MGKGDETTPEEGDKRELMLHGFPVFPSRGGVVTNELIKRLIDEEDEELIAFANRRRNENDPGH